MGPAGQASDTTHSLTSAGPDTRPARQATRIARPDTLSPSLTAASRDRLRRPAKPPEGVYNPRRDIPPLSLDPSRPPSLIPSAPTPPPQRYQPLDPPSPPPSLSNPARPPQGVPPPKVPSGQPRRLISPIQTARPTYHATTDSSSPPWLSVPEAMPVWGGHFSRAERGQQTEYQAVRGAFPFATSSDFPSLQKRDDSRPDPLWRPATPCRPGDGFTARVPEA